MTLLDPALSQAPHAPVDIEAVLIVRGDDRPGLVAAIAGAIAAAGGNIISLAQYSDDPDGGRFFQRCVFRVDGRDAPGPSLDEVIGGALSQLGLEWRLSDRSRPKRVAVLASTSDHCLLDLLWRQRRGEIPMVISMVISNHTDVAEDVRQFDIPFFHVPSSGPDKSAAEAEIVRLIAGNVDLVVLARYMQILSGDFLERVEAPVINIHHSFLPAFVGAGPYKKAKDRGVKLIGATAHYVTEDLDEGPIIEQDVVRVSHEDSVADLQRRGADVERQVLSRAVAWHCEDRVVRNGRETIVL